MHTPDQKAEVMQLLAANGGDVARTHLQTSVPERTLYSWRRELWRKWRQQTPPPNSLKPLPEFENKMQAYTFLREKILAKLINLANNDQDSAVFATPAQQMNFMSQLLDRVMKLDAYLKPYEPREQTTFWVTDSDSEEPDGDEGEGVEVMFQDGDHLEGPFTPMGLNTAIINYGVPPQMVIYFHRPRDKKLMWSGLLTLFPSPASEEE